MTCPEELELELDRETVLEQVIEKPDARTYETHSVLVSRGETEDGETRNIFRQGFTGTCEYAFKGASDAVRNAVVALALFGEFGGVGSAVARGCGCVEVTVKE
jgi:CRISPR/Cas system CMR-associated protein Cmr1 (group 7 of RAMP superfamily)